MIARVTTGLMSATIALATLARGLSAQPGGPSVDSLVARADLIVAGVETAIVEPGRTVVQAGTGSLVKRKMSVTVSVDRVLKGTLAEPSVQFLYELPGAVSGNPRVSTDYRLFFLKRVDVGYVMEDWPTSVVIAARTTSPPGGSAVDRVATVIGAVIRAKDSTAQEKTQAILKLRFATSSEADAAIRFALDDPDPSVRFRAAAMLLDMNDVTALPLVEEALLHPEKQEYQYMAWLRSDMERGLRDPAAIPSLGRIFLAGDIEARVAAAAALRNTGSPDAIPFLAKGLTDPVLDVRFWAVAGLAEITGDKGRSTTRKDFDSAGQQYVTYWTAWARSRGLIKRP